MVDLQVSGARRGRAQGEVAGALVRVRWYVWLVALAPAGAAIAAGMTGVLDGRLRASVMLSAFAVTFAAVAILMLLGRPWRATSGCRRTGRITGAGVALVLTAVTGVVAFDTVRTELFATPVRGVRAVGAVNGQLIAVGTDSQQRLVAWVSADGLMWQRAAHAPELDDIDVRDAATISDRLVIAGQTTDTGEGVVVTTADGRTWVRSPTFGDSLNPETQPNAIAGVGDNLAMVGDTYGNSAVFWHSTDGSEWTVTGPVPVFDRGDRVLDVTSWGNGFIAVGFAGDGTAASWLSPDGANWTAVSTAMVGDNLQVAARDDVAVAVANNSDGATPWTSADGQRWAAVGEDPFGEHQIDVITDTPSGFVAFGVTRDSDQPGMWTSRDGATWRASAVAPATFGDADIHDLAVIDDAIVAVGHDASTDQAAFWVAKDGRTWRRIPPDETTFALD